MYTWVSHMWGVGIGCPHQCSYCYVSNRGRKQPTEWTLDRDFPPLGKGRTIFIAHLCDLFSRAVPEADIKAVLDHCRLYPENKYVFQTKDTGRLAAFVGLDYLKGLNYMVGTTIETNRQDLLDKICSAPNVGERASGMCRLHCEKFLTIEPIMQFDTGPLADLVSLAKPDFVNIGADSKGHGLEEPTREGVMVLAREI